MDSGAGTLDVNPEPELPSTSSSDQSNFSHSQPDIRRSWEPERGAGQLVGAALSLTGILLTVIVADRASDTNGAGQLLWWLATLLFLVISCIAVFLLRQLRSVRYLLTDDALVTAFSGKRIEIPYREIGIVALRPRDVIDFEGYERYWPGYYDSLGNTSDGYWRSIATTPPRERVRIHTRDGSILAISPHRPVLFVEALDYLRHGSTRVAPAWPEDDEEPPGPLGLAIFTEPTAADAAERDRPLVGRGLRLSGIPTPFAYRILRERIVRGDPVASRLLALNLLVLITLVFLAAWKVDSVIQPLPVKWNPSGEPTWTVRPDGFWLFDGVWIYPVTAAAIVGVNTALATLAAVFGRMLEARLLLSGAFISACFLLLAMIRTTGLI